MSLPIVTPSHAKRLIDAGATLIDIRGADEHARERIDGARNVPLDKLTKIDAAGGPVVFHCRSGARSSTNAARLAACVDGEAYLLDGGIDAWKHAGFAVRTDQRQPIELMRQVQIAAGTLVLLGVLLGAFVSSS